MKEEQNQAQPQKAQSRVFGPGIFMLVRTPDADRVLLVTLFPEGGGGLDILYHDVTDAIMIRDDIESFVIRLEPDVINAGGPPGVKVSINGRRHVYQKYLPPDDLRSYLSEYFEIAEEEFHRYFSKDGS